MMADQIPPDDGNLYLLFGLRVRHSHIRLKCFRDACVDSVVLLEPHHYFLALRFDALTVIEQVV